MQVQLSLWEGTEARFGRALGFQCVYTHGISVKALYGAREGCCRSRAVDSIAFDSSDVENPLESVLCVVHSVVVGAVSRDVARAVWPLLIVANI